MVRGSVELQTDFDLFKLTFLCFFFPNKYVYMANRTLSMLNDSGVNFVARRPTLAQGQSVPV